MTPLSPIDESVKRAGILVVDDDPVVRELVGDAIAEAGFEVDVCGDGVEALGKNAAKAYDLIVTDMRLPGLDGLSLIRNLKAGKSGTDVIVITGYGSIDNAVQCMKAGALEYLIKPLSVDQIQMAVRKAVEHRELKRRAQEREFYRELSYIDSLTGIHNRRYFDEALSAETEKSMRHGLSLVLVMIDIDDFKIYNDCNGHQKGDEALAKMAQLFKSTCRGYDIVARYGGEEFAIVFPGASKENALELSSRIMNAVRTASFEGERLMPSGSLNVSMGVACFPEHATNAEDLIRASDQALYAAKKAGGNTVKMTCPGADDSATDGR
ncbi:MAG: diguanylate cyclase [Desulfomonilaceae bacterium]